MLRLTLLALCLVAVRAMMVCPPNYCSNIDCAPLTDCNGAVRANGGFCGCCDTCITQIAEGESCSSLMLMGVPSTQECGQGLVCDPHTWKCVNSDKISRKERATGECAARLAEIQTAMMNGLPLVGVEKPQCDANGGFKAAQCFGSVCYCSDDSGNEIDGYSNNIGELALMNCQCARDKVAYMKTGLIGKLFFCDKYGNYPVTQSASTAAPVATGSQTGTQTGTGTGSQTGTGFFGTPDGASGPCAKELQSAQSSSLLGAFVPHCDADGLYAPRQCQGSECYCVRKDGTKIGDYSAPIASMYQVTCQCARDKDMAESGGLFGGKIHTCRQNGNYQQYQCLGSVCYCTDDSGARIETSSVPIANINDLKC